MTDIDTGLNVWQMTSNHNRMIELQAVNFLTVLSDDMTIASHACVKFIISDNMFLKCSRRGD